nr:hypothetical protein [Planctomycetota bacterium]
MRSRPSLAIADMPQAGGGGRPDPPAAEPIVVVLARAPELGLVKSRLARDLGDAAALAVYRTLLACTARAVRAWDGRAVVHFSGSAAALAGSPLGWLPRLP